MDRLKGKVALVTGAGQGIGRAIAELFASEGAVMVATDLKEPARKFDGIEFQTLDVTQSEDWKRVVADILARHKRTDVARPRLTARLLQETTRLMVESAVPFGTRPKVVT